MLEAYETFLAVVENETASAAAEVLHTTQPTVTRQIQQLERALGTALFDRVGKRLILTRAGERVYDTARELLQTQNRLLDALSELADPEQGTVRLGSGVTPSIYLLPNVIANYAVKHPAVRFQIVTGSSKVMTERLKQREIDLAFVTTPRTTSLHFVRCRFGGTSCAWSSLRRTGVPGRVVPYPIWRICRSF
ncbi:hypothetical protein GCM10025859_56980 [Alicyclobacillus fastidiosus]|nr:hypothetical protein GCM10025859_56980 [Alicyclobacillus fastidiosus]